MSDAFYGTMWLEWEMIRVGIRMGMIKVEIRMGMIHSELPNAGNGVHDTDRWTI